MHRVQGFLGKQTRLVSRGNLGSTKITELGRTAEFCAREEYGFGVGMSVGEEGFRGMGSVTKSDACFETG